VAIPQTETLSRTLPVEPDVSRDHTSQWGGRIAPGLSPAAYQRYAPPSSRTVCLDQIEALTDIIASIAENIEARRQEAALLAEQDLDCDETQRGLRRASDAKRKYESARSAYLFWLKVEDGGTVGEQAPAQPAAPSLPMRERVALLSQALRLMAETYRADLAETMELHEAEAAVGQVLTILDQLEDQ